MAWLTPEEFETAVKIERKEGGGGFGALIEAARLATIKNYARYELMNKLWPFFLYFHHDEAGAYIAKKYDSQRFEVFLSAAALHADLENQRRIEQICPGLNEEISIRYNTPLSLMPGEEQKYDGRMWRCLDEKLSEFRYRVVEVSA